MEKYVRVMDGLNSNASGFQYKLNEVNISTNWNKDALTPKEMGGFNFSTEDKILRWLHRGDTIYDVIIPDGAETVICDSEKGIYRANKIIVTNPRIITDKEIIELYKKTTLSDKIIAQCLEVLLWKDKLEISKYIIKDRVTKDNVDTYIKEFEDYISKNNFNNQKLNNENKILKKELEMIKNKN